MARLLHQFLKAYLDTTVTAGRSTGPLFLVSFLAGDFPRSFCISHWLKLCHMLWQWLPVAAPSLCLPFTASHTANCDHVTKSPPMRASCWLKYRCPVQSPSSHVGPEAAKWNDSQVSSWEPRPWCRCRAPGCLTPDFSSPRGNYTCILFKATVIFISCSFSNCFAMELNLISISLLKTVLANGIV